MEDAQRAGLAGKDVWKKYPKMMLRARCLSDGIASHCPETARGLRVYGEGEIGGSDPAPPSRTAAAPAEVPLDAQAVVMASDAQVANIVLGADSLGLLGTLQAAASHASHREVGDCSTTEAAAVEIGTLTEQEAAKVLRWLERKSAEADQDNAAEDAA